MGALRERQGTPERARETPSESKMGEEGRSSEEEREKEEEEGWQVEGE